MICESGEGRSGKGYMYCGSGGEKSGQVGEVRKREEQSDGGV